MHLRRPPVPREDPLEVLDERREIPGHQLVAAREFPIDRDRNARVALVAGQVDDDAVVPQSLVANESLHGFPHRSRVVHEEAQRAGVLQRCALADQQPEVVPPGRVRRRLHDLSVQAERHGCHRLGHHRLGHAEGFEQLPGVVAGIAHQVRHLGQGADRAALVCGARRRPGSRSPHGPTAPEADDGRCVVGLTGQGTPAAPACGWASCRGPRASRPRCRTTCRS